MNNKKSVFNILGICLLASNSLFASPSSWKTSELDSISAGQEQARNGDYSSLRFRKVEIIVSKLANQLGKETNLNARSNTTSTTRVIEIPLPNGKGVKVSAEETSVMAPELAAKYPQIKTWRVTGVNDPEIRGRIDITEHGFHAMLEMPDGDTIFVEPDKNTADQYLSFSKRNNRVSFNTDFQCGVNSENSPALNFSDSSLRSKKSISGREAWDKLTYRVAIAATGEYTQFHGGTKSKALSAIVTTINRVNEVFETDLSIKLELIADEDKIIYTNSFTDPYTNNDTRALLEENVFNLTDSGDLLHSNYDIGHVFGTGNFGGIAQLGSACKNFSKAAGVTGISNPIGDVFSISYVAHEIGHQLGATHSFNSSCNSNREAATAWEPGSGSTIMSYAGVCSLEDDLQSHSDPQFHVGNIAQIDDFVRFGDGASCGTTDSVTNQDPSIDAGSDYTIPTRTPFSLTASGSDSDGDTVSYTWEQFDTGTQSGVNVDTGDNAIFRSRPKNISPTRSIPRLNDLANGVLAKGEHLAVNDRDVTFQVTARDGKGGVSSDGMKLSLVSTGRPFSVTSHRLSDTLMKGERTNITWDVAGTNSAPISCQNVNLWLVQPNADNYLLETTPNDGQEDVNIPTSLPDMDAARILVACSDNIFYNISFTDLKVRAENLNSGSDDSSGGGSMGYFLLMLFALGIKRVRRGL